MAISKLAVLAALAALTAIAPSSAAVLQSSVSYESNDPVASDSAQSAGGLVTLTGNLSNATITGSAFSDYGVLKVGGAITATSTGYTSSRGVSAGAHFEDQIIINSGLAGTPGTATFAVRLSAVASISGSNGVTFSPSTGAMVQIDFSGGGVSAVPFVIQTTQAYYYGSLERSGYKKDDAHPGGQFFTPVGPYEFDGLYTLSVHYSSGTPFTISASAFCQAGVSFIAPGQSGTASCDMTHSVDWLGMTFATDSSGTPIAAATTSASGFNYGSFSAGVPEPADWALLVVGFGLTGSIMRRRRLAVCTPNNSISAKA